MLDCKLFKVVIDGTILAREKISGIGRYTIEIVNVLAKYKNIEYILLKPKPLKFYRTFWHHFILPKLCKEENIDILFLPAGSVPIYIPKNIKIVVTIHDLRWKLFPEFTRWPWRKYFDVLISHNINKADAIIVPSNYVKKTIVKYFPNVEEKIHVIYEGCRTDKFRFLNLPRKKQMLFIGSIAKHKNIQSALKAFAKIYTKIPHKLIIVGKKETALPISEEIKKCLNIIPQNRVEFMGYLSDEEIVKLYNESDFFVFPSFHEGFGLPPLEAMACGCPVLVSNVASLPEICEDAAVYCNPYDIDNIAEKMLQLASDEELKEKLRQKGLERAKRFSWEKAGKEHIELFKSLFYS